MLRESHPYNGKRYLLNTNTGEIHDLLKEMPHCKIDEIKPEHIRMSTTYMDCVIAGAILSSTRHANGCHYCNPDKDTG